MPSPTADKHRVRSPSFPFISLREAVERARVFYRREKHHAAPTEVVVGYWGYSSLKSSGAPRTIATLRSYGLLEGDDVVRLTDRAVAILREETPEDERQAALRDLALLPSAHHILWSEYKEDLPSDATLRHVMVEKLGFNPDSVDGFLRNYRETLAFAGLTGSPQKAAAVKPPPLPPPSPSPTPEHRAGSADLTLRFPLLHGNQMELRVAQKVPQEEAEQLRQIFDLWMEKIVER